MREYCIGHDVWKLVFCTAVFLIALFPVELEALKFSDYYSHQIIDEGEDRPIKPYIKLLGDLSGDGKADILVASAKGCGIVWNEFIDLVINEIWFKNSGWRLKRLASLYLAGLPLYSWE